MRLLIDTHLLLWAAAGEAPAKAAAMIEDPATTPVFSAASIWEVAIKSALGRAEFRADPARLRRGLLDNGYEELPVTGAHAAYVVRLPPVHKDPFDRLLVAQANAEDLALLTADATLARYPGAIIVV